MVSCFWAAESKSFGSLAAARAVQGFAMAPMEALVPASIADIWFVHERGFQSAVFNLGVLGGINLASPIGKLWPYQSYECKRLIIYSWRHHSIWLVPNLPERNGRRLRLATDTHRALHA